MKVLITQPRNKEHLVKAFIDAGADVTARLDKDVKLIIPTVDEELVFFSNSREWFKDAGIMVAVNNEYVISECRDTAEFYRFCRRHGFKTPLTMQADLLAKPRFGKGSRGQFRIGRDYIVKEYIDGDEYSIDYYDDGRFLSVIPRLRLNVVNGEAKEAGIVSDPLLIEEATRLGKELGLQYHNVMQCFYDGKSVVWIEVNCRYGGGSWLTFHKFNSPKKLVELTKERF